MEFYSAFNPPESKPTCAGEEKRKTYRWAENENGEKELVEDEEISIADEIESYHEETKITNIINRATFDVNAANMLLGDNGNNGRDMTVMPENLMEAQNLMVKAKAAYAALSPKQQAEFNGIADYMATAGTEEWAKKLGYITEQPIKEEKKNESE
nr:MAG TPA: Scaffold protein [Microviridae sp.]